MKSSESSTPHQAPEYDHECAAPPSPSLIVVVEKDVLPQGSRLEPSRSHGFTMVGGAQNGARSAPTDRKPTTTAELPESDGLSDGLKALSYVSLILPVLPGGLLINALALGVDGASHLLKMTKAKSDEEKQTLADAKEEARTFLVNHAITAEGARLLRYRFAPGHPRANVAYRLHPLADVPGSGHEARYIPQDCFDQMLLDERESELLRLLVELGATRIVITEKRTSKTRSATDAEIKGDVAKVGEAELSASHTSAQHDTESNTREFQLVGKSTLATDRIREQDFAWLAFEPGWKAMVQARQIGQCSRATLELKEDASYANETKLQAMLRLAGRGGSVSAKHAAATESSTAYTFHVEFGPFSGLAG